MKPAWITGQDALREGLLNPGQVPGLSGDPGESPPAPPSGLPDYLESFLAHLRLLVGVPFEYLVADARLLPDESIRFFYVDRSWTDRLVDGALSVGKIGTREQAHHQARHPAIRAHLDRVERVVRALQRGTDSFARPAPERRTIRSPPSDDGIPHALGGGRAAGRTSRCAPLPARAPTPSRPRCRPCGSSGFADGAAGAVRGRSRLVFCEEPHHGVAFGVEILGPSFRLRVRSADGRAVAGPRRRGPVRAGRPAGARGRRAASPAPRATRGGSRARVPQTGAAAFALDLLALPWRQRFEGAARAAPARPWHRLLPVAAGSRASRGPRRSGARSRRSCNEHRIAILAAHGISADGRRHLVAIACGGCRGCSCRCTSTPWWCGRGRSLGELRDAVRRTTGEDGAPADAQALAPGPSPSGRAARAAGSTSTGRCPTRSPRGDADGSAGRRLRPAFPPLPDRWLVLRLSPSLRTPGARAVRGWVLEAGGRRGRARDLDGWTEPGAGGVRAAPPLTALGHGDPAWAAYYDNVENRLCFHDPLADVSAGPLAYLVCGWHTDEGLDPLGGPDARVAAVRLERLRELGWSGADLDLERAGVKADLFRAAALAMGLPHRTAPPGERSLLTLYHGAVVGVAWPGTGWAGAPEGVLGGEVGGPPPASSIDVVIGSTMAEAVAALSSSGDRPFQARIVEAVAAGSPDDLDAADGRAQVDAALHARALVSYDGGVTTETVWQPPSEPQPVPPGRPPRPFPDIAVNAGTLAATLPSLDSSPETGPPPPRVRVQAVETIRHHLRSRGRGRDAEALAEVVSEVSPPPPPPPSPSEPGKFVEVTRSLPRFHAPLDPVLLVRGARRSFRHGGDGRFSRDNTLACRVTAACVTELSILADVAPTGARGERLAVRGESLLSRGIENGSVPPECEELLREIVLLDPGSADAAARSALGAGGGPTSSELAERAHRFAVEQTAYWALREPRVDPAPIRPKRPRGNVALAAGDHPAGEAVDPIARGLGGRVSPLRRWRRRLGAR